MDVVTKRRVTHGVRAFLREADLDVTTTRHVLGHLVHTLGVAETHESKKYVRRAIRTFMTERSAPALRLWVALRVAHDGRVACRIVTKRP